MPSQCRMPLVSSAAAVVLVCIVAAGAFVSADDRTTVSGVVTTTATAPTPTRCTLGNLTTPDVIKLSVLIRDRIYCFGNTTDEDGVRYHALIAGFVRLAFHSSIDRKQGGCINLLDGHQAGLRVAVEELEKLYQQSLVDSYYAKVSRADFWALAGIVALEQATAGAVSITYRYGRCDACVDTFDTNATLKLPSQTFSGDQVIGYLRALFNLTAYEAIALMGAHSLGVVTDPGRKVLYGKWVLNPEALSNGYFADMADPRFLWKQVKREFSLEQPREVWSWTHGDNKRVYLNCDMSLYKDLDAPGDDGESSCTYFECPVTRFRNVVLAYARDAALFRAYFRDAFGKMINGNVAGLRTPV